MEKQIPIYLSILVLLFLNSCGSIVPLQPQITKESILKIPETKGAIRIPLEVNLEPYLEMADKSIPKTFRGNEEKCDGVSFKYYFIRQPIEFSGSNKTMGYQINGEYNIRANYCAQCSSVFGSDPFCLTPRIYVSCGVGEPLRKIGIDFQSDIKIEPYYLLNSKTRLTSVKAIDPCELSFFNYDASKLIEEEMSAYLRDFEEEIDEQIRKVDIKTPISKAWDALQESILIPDLGYLYFRPRAIDIESISFTEKKANVIINMELSPIFSSDSISRFKQKLPFLSTVKSDEDFNLPLQTLVSYDSINSILRKQVNGMVIPFKKKQIIISDATALGPVGTQLLFKVQFIGSKKGILYLLGTPNYNAITHEISFPDLTFDIRTRDAVLKTTKWLFDRKLTDAFRSKATFDLTEQIEIAQKEIEKQLNAPIEFQKGQFVYLSGKMSKINFSKLQIGANELRIVIDLEGNLSLKL